MNTDEIYSNSLKKLLNSDLIKGIYPMIDNIEVYFSRNPVTDSERIDLYVFLNDSSINRENMYVKGFDPEYMVDRHIRDLMKFLDITDRVKIFTHLINPKNVEFYFSGY